MTTDGLQYWDRHATNYDRSISRLCRSTPLVIELVEQRVAGAQLALEVGAGSGLFSTAIAPRVGQLVATDYSPGMIELLKTRIEASKQFQLWQIWNVCICVPRKSPIPGALRSRG